MLAGGAPDSAKPAAVLQQQLAAAAAVQVIFKAVLSTKRNGLLPSVAHRACHARLVLAGMDAAIHTLMCLGLAQQKGDGIADSVCMHAGQGAVMQAMPAAAEDSADAQGGAAAAFVDCAKRLLEAHSRAISEVCEAQFPLRSPM